MSVLIKGMRFPQNCVHCELAHDEGFCIVTGTTWGQKRNADCPLIELPDHGDLIDRDAMMFDTEERYCTGCDSYRGLRCRACWVDDMHGEIVDAPVVIPAERSENGKTKQISAEFAKLMREGEIQVRWRE